MIDTVRTPLTLITGPLGSGKTTLLRNLLETVPAKMAILMNEFGEIAIDARVIKGKNVRIAELAGGCVCCSLAGEFEVAVQEVIDNVGPEIIVVETTGVAEPDALVFDIQDRIPQVRLDGVIAVADADALARYPQLGRAFRSQIEGADAVLLNKLDLVSTAERTEAKAKIARMNGRAPVIETRFCRVDPALLFGVGWQRELRSPDHVHQTEFESFVYITETKVIRKCFEQFANRLPGRIYRAKGFVGFPEGSYLFNFVAGRWELESFAHEKTALVFIGRGIKKDERRLAEELKKCQA